MQVLDEQVRKRILLSDQIENLLAGNPDGSFHVAGELKTVLRPHEDNAVLVTIQSIEGIAHIQNLVESAGPSVGLKSTSNKLIFHVGNFVIDAVLEQTVSILFLYIVHLAHEIDEVLFL